MDAVGRPCRVLSSGYLVILFKVSSLCNLRLQLHGSKNAGQTNASMNYSLVIALHASFFYALDEPNASINIIALAAHPIFMLLELGVGARS